MLQFVPQRRQMLLDDRVERRILRLMALVAAGGIDDPKAAALLTIRDALPR